MFRSYPATMQDIQKEIVLFVLVSSPNDFVCPLYVPVISGYRTLSIPFLSKSYLELESVESINPLF
jgi:hypothetical protein